MPKITAKPNVKIQNVSIDTIKENLRKCIKDTYNMTVREFAHSEELKKLRITVKPNTIELALAKSNSASTNFKLYIQLYKAFDLGTLSKRTTRTITVDILVQK